MVKEQNGYSHVSQLQSLELPSDPTAKMRDFIHHENIVFVSRDLLASVVFSWPVVCRDSTQFMVCKKMGKDTVNSDPDRACIEKLQKFIESTDVSALESMSYAEKLQYVLSSKDFMSNMAAGLLVDNKKTLYTSSKSLEPHYIKNIETSDNSCVTEPANTLNNSNSFLNEFSKEEKLEIQKKLAIYDRTLKMTLEAIKNGKISEDIINSSLSSDHLTQSSEERARIYRTQKTQNHIASQNLPSDTDVNILLKNIESNNVRKLKVDDNITVSLESADKQFEADDKPNKNPDEYIEQMVQIINQDKKFDNFLEEVSKLENFNKQDSVDTEETSKYYDTTLQKANRKDELVFRHDQLSDIESEKVFRKMINTHIIKALESFKLDEGMKKDISGTIAKSIENNTMFHGKNDDRYLGSKNDEVPIEGFADDMKEFQKAYAEQLKDMNFEEMANYLQKCGTEQNILKQEDDEQKNLHHEQHKLERQLPEGQQKHQKNDDVYQIHVNGPAYVATSDSLNEADLGHDFSNYYSDKYMRPTLEERQRLQKECLERLHIHPDDGTKKSKKKKKNKKRSSAVSAKSINHIGLNDPHNDTWLCELCEYQIVYGEVPIFLTEWLQKKTHHHDKMESYQRYLMQQRKERKKEQEQEGNTRNEKHTSHVHQHRVLDEHGNYSTPDNPKTSI